MWIGKNMRQSYVLRDDDTFESGDLIENGGTGLNIQNIEILGCGSDNDWNNYTMEREKKFEFDYREKELQENNREAQASQLGNTRAVTINANTGIQPNRVTGTFTNPINNVPQASMIQSIVPQQMSQQLIAPQVQTKAPIIMTNNPSQIANNAPMQVSSQSGYAGQGAVQSQQMPKKGTTPFGKMLAEMGNLPKNSEVQVQKQQVQQQQVQKQPVQQQQVQMQPVQKQQVQQQQVQKQQVQQQQVQQQRSTVTNQPTAYSNPGNQGSRSYVPQKN